jgi:predicted alpha/beta-fold hydrolase
MRGMVKALHSYDFNVVAFHFRGCSKKPNRHPEAFHGGQTADLKEVIVSLKNRHADHRIFVVGFSIGGNILLKYLGESKESSLVDGAVAISVPFSLKQTQISLGKGFSQIYQHYLLARLKYLLIKKIIINRHKEIDPWSVLWIRNFNQFDELITAPLHGFRDAEEYYLLASSKHYLRDIRTKTLIIQAEDDPFFPKEEIPGIGELSPAIELLITKNGGHVGFVAGDYPTTAPIYWLEEVVPEYFLNEANQNPQGVRKS